jgi:hypothetical protein
VDLARLRHWVQTVDGDETEAAPATFVELPALPGVAGMTDADAGPSECTLEFEEPTGRKLRISLRGPATAQAVWSRQACMNLSACQGRMHWSLLRLWTRTADATTHADGQPGGSPATV